MGEGMATAMMTTMRTADVDVPAKVPSGAGETIFRGLCFGAATLLLAALTGVVLSLAIGGWPAFHQFGFGFITSTEWNPVTENYGAAGPIVGTIVTSLLALAIALPLAAGVASSSSNSARAASRGRSRSRSSCSPAFPRSSTACGACSCSRRGSRSTSSCRS